MIKGSPRVKLKEKLRENPTSTLPCLVPSTKGSTTRGLPANRPSTTPLPFWSTRRTKKMPRQVKSRIEERDRAFLLLLRQKWVSDGSWRVVSCLANRIGELKCVNHSQTTMVCHSKHVSVKTSTSTSTPRHFAIVLTYCEGISSTIHILKVILEGSQCSLRYISFWLCSSRGFWLTVLFQYECL